MYPKKLSTSCLVPIVLIPAGLLVKDKTKRLPLKQVLEHPWLTKQSQGLRDMRLRSPKIGQFKAYSHQQPHSPQILDEIVRRPKEDFGGT